MELDLMEAEEKQMSTLEGQISILYQLVHPQDHLRTIPGMGPRVAPLLLAAVGDIGRFPDAKALCQWTGVLPRSHQSSRTQLVGMGMAKTGPARVKRALYQAAEIARLWDPQLAAIHFRQMVDYGKTHRQAIGAIMSHLAVRMYVVLKEQRPYELRGLDDHPISMLEARKFIREHFCVPEEVRKLRRQHHRPSKKSMREEVVNAIRGHWDHAATCEAANAPQRGNDIQYPDVKDSMAPPLTQLMGKAS